MCFKSWKAAEIGIAALSAIKYWHQKRGKLSHPLDQYTIQAASESVCTRETIISVASFCSAEAEDHVPLLFFLKKSNFFKQGSYEKSFLTPGELRFHGHIQYRYQNRYHLNKPALSSEHCLMLYIWRAPVQLQQELLNQTLDTIFQLDGIYSIYIFHYIPDWMATYCIMDYPLVKVFGP